jgi:hypothetical protein
MTRAKYPLEPLARVRAHAVDAQAIDLARAVRAREQAEAERRTADDARGRAEAGAREVRLAEEAALARGALTVADLARADAWEVRVRAEGAALYEAVARAAESEAVAIGTEAAAQKALAQRRADADVVDKDRARFDGEQRRREDDRAEEDAAEAWRPK